MNIDLTAAIADVNRGIAEMRAKAEDPDLWECRIPEVSMWSVAQQVHHAGLVLSFVGMGVRGLLRGRGEAGPELTGVGRAILSSGEVPRGVAKAPKDFTPDDQPDGEAVLTLLARTEKTWGKVANQEGELAGITLRLPHPILGPLTAAEWVRFGSVHTDHHLKIVADILKHR